MIKIIKKGTTPPSRKMHCQNCGCKFSYQREDMAVDQRDANFVRCPQCDNTIFVDSWSAGREIFD